MSDQMGQQPIEDPDEPQGLKDLRAKADQATTLGRKVAFLEAGVPTKTPLGAMFADAYKGELTEEAITAAWAEIAPAQPAVADPPSGDTPPTPDEARLQAEQDAARRGIGSTPAEPHELGKVDPVLGAFDQFHADRRAGLTAEKASRPVFGSILAQAMEGNEKYLSTPWTPEELAGDSVR